MSRKSKKPKKKNRFETYYTDVLDELLGHRLVAPHLLRGCEVMVCDDTGGLSYVCVSECVNDKMVKHEHCSPLLDEHVVIKSLIDKETFSSVEKRALDLFFQKEIEPKKLYRDNNDPKETDIWLTS